MNEEVIEYYKNFKEEMLLLKNGIHKDVAKQSIFNDVFLKPTNCLKYNEGKYDSLIDENGEVILKKSVSLYGSFPYLNNKSGVYIIHNPKDERYYIGSSKNLYNRIREHRASLKNENHHNIDLQKDYNVDSDLFFFIHSITDNCLELNKLETEVIKEYEEIGVDIYNFWNTSKTKKSSLE